MTQHENLVTTSVDGQYNAWPYQEEGAWFIYKGHGENSHGFNAILGDQMRLGKTVQFLLALATAKRNGDNRFPCLIIVKPANTWQWIREHDRWFSEEPLSLYPINSLDAFLPPGFDVYVISMDLIGRKGRCKACKHHAERHKDANDQCSMKDSKTKKTCECRQFIPGGDSMVEKLLKLNFRVCCADEMHSFKNTDSARTRGLIQFLYNIAQHETEQEFTFSCPFTHDSNSSIFEKYGLSDAASAEDILKAIKLAAFAAHPDHGGTSESFRDYQRDKEKITELVLSGNHSKTKITWTEKIKIKLDDRNTTATTSKTSHCPVCDAWVSMTAQTQINATQKCGIVLLSGTAIVNNAEEYFVPLHLVAPHRVPNIASFRRNWLDENNGYKTIKPWRLGQFHDFIAPYVLRREHKDVYKELPPLKRSFTIISIDDEALKKLYNQTLDIIELDMNTKGRANYSYFDSIGELTKLRQICGLAKTRFAVQQIEAAMCDDNPYTRYAVGIHHHAVKDSLKLAFANSDIPILTLTGLDDAKEKDRIMREFMNSPERVTAINMLAGGVGMDFWYVENVLILERQFSSAYEDQFEARFYNPNKELVSQRMNEWLGSDIWPVERIKNTEVEYIVAKGTIDEYFYRLVENKRRILHETIDTDWHIAQDSVSWQELLEQTLANRL